MSDTTEAPTRYTITLANGQTKQFASPATVSVVAGSGLLKITMSNGTDVTWLSPTAWRSLDIRPQLKP